MLNFEQSAQLMTDLQFRGRVKVALLNYASRILSSGPNSNAAFRWAQQAFQQPDQTAQVVVAPTVMEPAIQGQGGDVDDGALQFSVENAVNKML